VTAPEEHRHVLLDKSLLYLFSFDVEADAERQNIGFVPGGVRVNIQARPNLSRVYHVLRDRSIAGTGSPAIAGVIEWGGDWLFLRDDDIGYSDVRFSIRTDDGAVIHGSYPVTCYLGNGGFRRLIKAGHDRDRLGTEKEPLDIPLITTPRFVTTSSAYNWLTELQCIGFGRIRVVRNEFRRITYDVYSLT
jgi:hypothetical protein